MKDDKQRLALYSKMNRKEFLDIYLSNPELREEWPLLSDLVTYVKYQCEDSLINNEDDLKYLFGLTDEYVKAMVLVKKQKPYGGLSIVKIATILVRQDKKITKPKQLCDKVNKAIKGQRKLTTYNYIRNKVWPKVKPKK